MSSLPQGCAEPVVLMGGQDFPAVEPRMWMVGPTGPANRERATDLVVDLDDKLGLGAGLGQP